MSRARNPAHARVERLVQHDANVRRRALTSSREEDDCKKNGKVPQDASVNNYLKYTH